MLVLCGPGNNGGDGYVAARLLAARGVSVHVAASLPPATELAKQAFARWGGQAEVLQQAHPAPVMIDALYGTGLSRALDRDPGAALRMLSAHADLILAADLPSGLSADDGADLGAIAADITIALGAAKPAHLLQPAAARCGRILIADIGVSVRSAIDVLERPVLIPPGPEDHKYTRGMVAVVGGGMAGAASLGAGAAARLAGYTVLCGEGDAPSSVVRRGFAATLADPRLDALLIGPGMRDTSENRAMLDAALASPVALVLDAGALALVTPVRLKRNGPTIVTPHAGEFDRMFGASTASKIDRARDAAVRSGATVVFKGSATVIASPDGRVTLSPAASPWLASAGTGDVLAGIVVAMLARGLNAHDAACAGVWLHGEAARLAGPGLIADDLIAQISKAAWS